MIDGLPTPALALLFAAAAAAVWLASRTLTVSTETLAAHWRLGETVAGLALVATGIGGAGFATMQATLTYLVVPPEMRGRALGVLSTAIGTGLLGFLQLGLLAELLGAPAATALVGAQGLLALLLTWRLWRPLLVPETQPPLSQS